MKKEDLDKIKEKVSYEFLLNKYFNNKFCLTVGQIKTKADKLDIPFDINTKDIVEIITFECPILKVPIDYFKEGKGCSDHSPSIDRVDPSKGYIRGNIQIISQKANRLKSNCTEDEVESILNYIRNNNGGS
jgi:hypothetical protein